MAAVEISKSSKSKSSKVYSLEVMFNRVLSTAQKLKKMDSFKGQDFWQPIKQILEQYDQQPAAGGWRKIPSKVSAEILSLTEYTINGRDEKTIIEQNHFIIQQYRIPMKEPATVKKIIQVALNIGQYKGTKPNKKLPEGFSEITDFISKSDISKVSAIISPEVIDEVNKYLDHCMASAT